MAQKYNSAQERSKWIKTKWLIRDKKLKKHIPETGLFKKGSLESFVARYKMVYFKPTYGTGGQGISRIDRIKKNAFRVKNNSGTTVKKSVQALHQKLWKLSKKQSYLLQQGIYLKDSAKNPFDLRVMVQKSKARGWVTTAIVTKLGKKGKVATNYHQGGRLAYLEDALRGAGYSKAKIEETKKKLKKMGVDTGKCFDRNRKGFRELGLDVAIDKKDRFWILEVNTRPVVYPIKYMKDKSLYRTIIKYAKEYGRTK